MRFNVIINQQKCLQYNLNVNQAAMMSLFNELGSWATEKVINGKMYWHISRNKVIEEIPLFYQKPDTVYRSFKFLAAENMIEYLQQNRMDFVRLTAKGRMWNKLGNKSELGNESEQLGNESEIPVIVKYADLQHITPVNSEMNPTYNIHNNTSNKREENALAFLERISPSDYETFCMQFKSQIADFKKFADDYSDTVIQEKLEWDPQVLFARLRKYARNWIGNQSGNNKTMPLAQVIDNTNNPSRKRYQND